MAVVFISRYPVLASFLHYLSRFPSTVTSHNAAEGGLHPSQPCITCTLLAAKSPPYLLNPLLVFFLSLEMTLHFQPHKLQAHSIHDPGGKSQSSLLGLCRKTEAAPSLDKSPPSLQIQQQRNWELGQSLLSAPCIFLSFPSLPWDRAMRISQLLLPLSKQDFSRAQSVGCLSFNKPRATLRAWLPGCCTLGRKPQPQKQFQGDWESPWMEPAPTGKHQGLSCQEP